MYLLPAIDILDGNAVRLAKGDYSQVTVYNPDPVDQAKAFEAAGARWVHVVDLDGAKSGRTDNIVVIERIIASTSLKVEVGGGLRSMEALRRVHEAGAARMVLGTALVSDPEFAQQAVEAYGAQLACGLDARDGEVAVSGWTQGSGQDAHDMARSLSAQGYRHLVYTDIARDGMQTGIDVGAYQAMAAAFGYGVIASGGIATLGDIQALAQAGDAVEAAIVGRALYEGSFALEDALQICRDQTTPIP